MKKTSLFLATSALYFAASSAFATGLATCDSGAKSTWQPVEKLEAQLKEKGYTVRRIKEDGGCYEVYGTTPEGDRVEAYFDPATFEKLYVARRGEVLFKKAQ